MSVFCGVFPPLSTVGFSPLGVSVGWEVMVLFQWLCAQDAAWGVVGSQCAWLPPHPTAIPMWKEPWA